MQVVHSVHGIMFKDLKQILRKEQCDGSILLTANVPSTKKVVVHGPQGKHVISNYFILIYNNGKLKNFSLFEKSQSFFLFLFL